MGNIYCNVKSCKHLGKRKIKEFEYRKNLFIPMYKCQSKNDVLIYGFEEGEDELTILCSEYKCKEE